MPRSRVKLAYIEDQKARRTSFMKRKECLKRKLDELSILCGIEACGILYSSFDAQPEVWPDDHNVVHNVLSEFMRLSPMERSRFMVNQDSYIKERMSKAKEQINKQIMVNREIAMDNMMSDCLSGKVSLASLNATHLKDLVSLAGHKLSEIEERIELLKSEAPAAAPQPQLQLPQPHETVDGSNTASHMVTEGMDVDAYVPVMDNTRALGVQTTGWYPPDWLVDNLVEPDLNFVPGFNMMMPFPDDPNYPLWSDASFPEEGFP